MAQALARVLSVLGFSKGPVCGSGLSKDLVCGSGLSKGLWLRSSEGPVSTSSIKGRVCGSGLSKGPVCGSPLSEGSVSIRP